MPPTTLGTLRKQRGLSARDMAAAIGCSLGIITSRIDHGDLAPNHPLVPKIATALGMTEPEVRALCRRKPMNPGQLALAQLRLGRPSAEINGPAKRSTPAKLKRKRGEQWGAWRQRQREARLAAKSASVRGKKPGTSLVHIPKLVPKRGRGRPMREGRAEKRAYAALRMLDEATRQSARSLAMATTIAAMQGHEVLKLGVTLGDLDLAVPTSGLAAILNDWLHMKGITEPVVLTVDYDKVFG